MGTTLLFLLLSALAVTGILGTLVLVSRDGYRAVPTRPHPGRGDGGAGGGKADAIPGARTTRVAGVPGSPGAAVSERAARRRDGMPPAGAPRTRAT
ncbi:hypothetical protein [Microbacterium oleivorans]|uniref:Uncharacterized protein n=1 Tax=Microbacterium oleivorans TaxID=273677 RepID=A0A7D5IYV8_9MICO|nr:hypothetical protein [Microbacterium oleivorans]QLD11595.1 hypothetical protein HW566_07300 [Microbacterium oleivorans]